MREPPDPHGLTAGGSEQGTSATEWFPAPLFANVTVTSESDWAHESTRARSATDRAEHSDRAHIPDRRERDTAVGISRRRLCTTVDESWQQFRA